MQFVKIKIKLTRYILLQDSPAYFNLSENQNWTIHKVKLYQNSAKLFQDMRKLDRPAWKRIVLEFWNWSFATTHENFYPYGFNAQLKLYNYFWKPTILYNMNYCSTVQNTALAVFRKTKNSLITSIRAESKLNQSIPVSLTVWVPSALVRLPPYSWACDLQVPVQGGGWRRGTLLKTWVDLCERNEYCDDKSDAKQWTGCSQKPGKQSFGKGTAIWRQL